MASINSKLTKGVFQGVFMDSLKYLWVAARRKGSLRLSYYPLRYPMPYTSEVEYKFAVTLSVPNEITNWFSEMELTNWYWWEMEMEWNGMEWNGNVMEMELTNWFWWEMEMEWNGMEWNGMEWNGMEWNGMEWNGMEWNGNGM
jgi:hypothetical protein